MDLDKLAALMELMHRHGAHYVKAGDVEINLVPQQAIETQPAAPAYERKHVPPHFDPDLYSDGVVPGMTLEQP